VTSKALIVAALTAGVAGAAGYYFLSARTPTAPAATALQAPLLAAPAARLAETVPDFKLGDRAGQLKSLHDWQGKALIVNFWATWCAPCRREIPLLEQLQRDHAAEDFQVVGIAVDFREKVLAYADEMQIQYPLLIGEQEALDAASAFGVDAIGFPFTIFTDTQHRVIAAHMGELTAREADLILGAVGAVNEGRSTPAEARSAIEAGMPALQPEGDPKNTG
jgi:thiol-disulfide isomerase/thioredoxin